MNKLIQARDYVENKIFDGFQIDTFFENAKIDHCQNSKFIVFDYDNETYEIDVDEKTLYNINEKDKVEELTNSTIQDIKNYIKEA